MTEIFLLGTFHFMERAWDAYSPSTQREIRDFVQKLAKFRPDAIAIEAAVHQQAIINSAYARISSADFENESLMRTATLGEITMFGQTVPISWNNECIQIGFRLAKLLSLPRVHAIDADMELDDTLLGEELPATIRQQLTRFREYIRENEGDTMLSSYQCLNTSECARLNHSVYLAANAVNTDGTHNGSSFTAQWYERNLRIFSEIQSLAKQYSRIFVLYGAGHLQILRDLIESCDGMKLVSLSDIL